MNVPRPCIEFVVMACLLYIGQTFLYPHLYIMEFRRVTGYSYSDWMLGFDFVAELVLVACVIVSGVVISFVIQTRCCPQIPVVRHERRD